MTVVCPSCGLETPEGFPRCANCGTELVLDGRAGREERKVVTCLFCDLVGFTARAETLDPEDVRELLQPYHARVRSELERFGGTVEKFIGDAVMAVFGAPTAHEDDPERAVRAAIAIRDWADEEGVDLRIGINTGEALVTVGREPLAAGDVVNTAARLQGAAPKGGILVGDMTHRATRDVVDYREESPVEAKGKSEPVRAWQALQARARVNVEREARAPLVGRHRELSLLRETLDRAHSLSEPQLVTLVGVPGIGKSRLVYELFRTLEERTDLVYWRHGRSLPYGEGVTFWALSEIVKAQAGILETDEREQAEAKLRAAVDAVAGDEDPRWLERHLRPLVGLERGEIAVDRRTEAFAAWRRFLESLAEHRPLVLVFEDLHWADDALLDFVDHFVEWARAVPLLVLATARPELLERRSAWGGGKTNATTLSLPPLGESETAELVHALLDAPVLPAATQAELVTRAGGNPLYAEEFARLVAEGRTPDELPETVQGLIAARLDAVGRDEKAVLQAAAVIGRTFWLGAVSHVGAMPRWTVEELLHSLERKDFVRHERRSSVAGEDEYVFRHVLIRDVAYGGVPRRERAHKHRLAASWIESLGRAEDHAELLAEHYLSAIELARATGESVDDIVDAARAVLMEAGERASSLNSFASAARFYERALDLMPADDAARGVALLRHGRALHYAFDPRAEQVLEDASALLREASDGEQGAEAEIMLSELWWDRGQRERGFTHLERARALLGDSASEARARLLARLARTQTIAGAYEEAVPAATEALAIAEQLGRADIRVHALASLGVARLELGEADGRADLEQSVALGVAVQSHLAANALNNLAFMYSLAGDVRRDEELREEALRLAEQFADRRMLTFAHLCLPMLRYFRGDWDWTLKEANAAIEAFEAGSPHYLESNIRWTRALIYLAQARDRAASDDMHRSMAVARQAKDPQVMLASIGVALRLALELGRTADARELAQELLEQRPAHAAYPPAIELAWAAGSVARAEDVRSWVERIAYASRWSEAALAILDGELERAAEIFDEAGSQPDEARARLRAGDPENVGRALTFYRSVGATRYIAEAEARLGDAGVEARA